MHKACLARLWATLLPFLLAWEYNTLLNLVPYSFTSSTSRPHGNKFYSCAFNAWIKFKASPSRTIFWKPSSCAKDRAFIAAKAFVSPTLKGWLNFSTQEAKTAPSESHITIPTPDSLEASAFAPSKFNFTNPFGGAIHLFPPLPWLPTYTSEACKSIR